MPTFLTSRVHRSSRIFGISLAAVLATAGCSSSSTTSSSTQDWPPVEIAVSDNEYTPANISVHVGQSVHWTYGGRNQHDIKVADEPSGFGISLEEFSAANGTYTYTFVKKGTFVYYCSIHGTKNGRGMAGTIKVTK